MHEIAEHGIAAHWAYKEGKGTAPEATAEGFSWLSQLMQTHRENRDSHDFLESVKLELFADEVFVFTPAGDIKALPMGSTPLDFAYSIHSEVGNHCTHAKVNGRGVSLRHVLKNGDVVEIVTRKDQRPREEWLDIVKSSRAKSKIRQHIRAEKKQKAKEMARDMLGAEVKKYGLKLDTLFKKGKGAAAAEALRFQSVDQMLIAVGYGKLQAETVVQKMVPPDQLQKDDSQPSAVQRFGQKLRSFIGRPERRGIRLAGMDGEVMVTYARCCGPVYGEEIVGYVTRGRGIVVHSTHCPRIRNLENERMVEVEWESLKAQGEDTAKRRVTVRVVCQDQPGLLSEMSAAFSSRGVNIAQAHCRTQDNGLATNMFDVLVTNVTQLQQAMSKVESIDGVMTVERVQG